MGLWARLKRTFRGGGHSAEIEEELRFHLEMDVADGQLPRDAHLRLGNVTRIGEETRSMGIVEWLDSALQDVRYGLRQLRRTPLLVLAVVFSLTVGVGANTAIFTLVDAAILRPVPVNDPAALRIIEWTGKGFPEHVNNINGDFHAGRGGSSRGSSIGADLYRSLAREQTAFDALIGVADANQVAVALNGEPVGDVSIQYVSANFFQGLGVPPVIGRSFLANEDRVGAAPVVVVSHRFWTSYLGSNPDLANHPIRINNVPVRIAGVAPERFFGLNAGQWTDIYAPIAARVALTPAAGGAAPRGEDDADWWIRQIARLKPGASEEAARSEIAGLFRTIVASRGGVSDPSKIPQLVTSPGERGFQSLSPKDARALWILLLLVAVVLSIVCVNVANLLLSRSVRRQHESAIRVAIGAARLRLFRQHLIESGILALAGGAAGLGLGYLLASGIHLLFETGRGASSAFDLHPNLRVLAYTAAISILTALLFGLAPALRAAHADPGGALKAQSRSVMGGRLRLPQALVSLQIALCLAALMAAGLLTRSLENLKWKDVGFDRENLAYATVNPRQAGYSPERLDEYAARVRDTLARIPGVLRVAITEIRPLSGNGNAMRVAIPGDSARIERGVIDFSRSATRNNVGAGYFETVGIPLIAGRTFELRDFQPKSQSAIVDEVFARQYFPGQNAVGRRFGFNQNDPVHYEIVGVVRYSRYNSLRDEPVPAVYFPLVPAEFRGALHFAIRARIDSAALASSARRAIAGIDSAVPMSQFHTQTGLIDRLLRTERLLGFVSGVFALVCAILAAIGLGGVLAYAVTRRTAEIGVRMALGATAGEVIRMVLRDSIWMAGGGILAGIPCAYAIGKYLRSSLYGIEPFDATTAILSAAALVAAALIAAWIPARRAARIDPIAALREE